MRIGIYYYKNKNEDEINNIVRTAADDMNMFEIFGNATIQNRDENRNTRKVVIIGANLLTEAII